MSRLFTVSEMYGPFPCEVPGCDGAAWSILLSDEENDSLVEKSGPEAIRQIMTQRLGGCRCDAHLHHDMTLLRLELTTDEKRWLESGGRFVIRSVDGQVILEPSGE